jgi:hypothetical protein
MDREDVEDSETIFKHFCVHALLIFLSNKRKERAGINHINSINHINTFPLTLITQMMPKENGFKKNGEI